MMRRGVVRALYSCLLGLHPEPFRVRFRDEMLQVFDSAAETYGAAWLLGDAVISLGRQRVFRSQQVAELPASAAGLMSGVYLDSRPPHLTCPKLGLALLLSLLSVFLFPPREPVQRHRAEVVSCCREVRHEFMQRQ
jgi:hypothetical protein